MRKVLAIAIVLGLLFIGSAESTTQLSKTYIIENDAPNNLTTLVPITTIVPGIHKIVGYSVLANLDSGAGAWCTLYSGPTAESNIIGESEALADSTDGEVWGYPKAVKGGGLTIHQSCYSTVFIEYSR